MVDFPLPMLVYLSVSGTSSHLGRTGPQKKQAIRNSTKY